MQQLQQLWAISMFLALDCLEHFFSNSLLKIIIFLVWSVIILLELLPGFSLYRGLYEFGQYSLRGFYSGSRGMQWKHLKDKENGLRHVFPIMLFEWLIIMPLAYYLDQSAHSRKKSIVGEALKIIKGKLHPRVVRTEVVDAHFETEVENPDVLKERLLVKDVISGQAPKCAIVCDGLRKIYKGKHGAKPKYAVRGLSVAIPQGECFGMLGPNGAGKTSSINMMIGLAKPSSGTAYIDGLDITKEMDQIHLRMGVCPQFDLLWETLTGREHLLFYGRLKNIKEEQLNEAVNNALKSVNLLTGGFGDKQVGTYSGGMKRRLSVAISLVGDPKVVYMDEPSAGLDPASRNFLWGVVKKAKKGRAIILTTHSMEEAETLCDRVGIFVKGRLQCVGNSEDLKSRYGGSYVFTICTPPVQEDEAEHIVHKMVSTSKRIYRLSGTQKFEMPKKDVTISDVFSMILSAKEHINIHAWGFTNTTLEDVFLKVVEQSA